MTEPVLNGGQFSRTVSNDPEKWARQFLAAYAETEGLRTDEDRQAFVASFFKDAMDTAVQAALNA